jgi:hypothetical protein
MVDGVNNKTKTLPVIIEGFDINKDSFADKLFLNLIEGKIDSYYAMFTENKKEATHLIRQKDLEEKYGFVKTDDEVQFGVSFKDCGAKEQEISVKIDSALNKEGEQAGVGIKILINGEPPNEFHCIK